MKLSRQEMQDIVDNITYKPTWCINLKEDERGLYVQISATTLDSVSLVSTSWTGGKNYLSEWMCRQEVVGVVFSAIEKAELHEMREFFRYKGASIYNPHLDPDALVAVARKASSFNMRDNAMTMTEGH